MIQQENPTLACAGIGPVTAAISRNLILHKVYDRVKKCQSVTSSQENRHTCAGYRHSIARSARRPLQP